MLLFAFHSDEQIWTLFSWALSLSLFAVWGSCFSRPCNTTTLLGIGNSTSFYCQLRRASWRFLSLYSKSLNCDDDDDYGERIFHWSKVRRQESVFHLEPPLFLYRDFLCFDNGYPVEWSAGIEEQIASKLGYQLWLCTALSCSPFTVLIGRACFKS